MFRGEWWLRGARDRAVIGTLIFDRGDGLTLDAIGLFRDPFETQGTSEIYPIIHGRTTDSKDVTLCRCIQTSSSCLIQFREEPPSGSNWSVTGRFRSRRSKGICLVSLHTRQAFHLPRVRLGEPPTNRIPCMPPTNRSSSQTSLTIADPCPIIREQSIDRGDLPAYCRHVKQGAKKRLRPAASSTGRFRFRSFTS